MVFIHLTKAFDPVGTNFVPQINQKGLLFPKDNSNYWEVEKDVQQGFDPGTIVYLHH